MVQDLLHRGVHRRDGGIEPVVARHRVAHDLRHGPQRQGTGSRFLSHIHPRFFTPTHAVILVGFVSLLAVPFSLESPRSLINFGALIAFTFVNVTVIVYFAFRLKERPRPSRSSPTSSCRASGWP